MRFRLQRLGVVATAFLLASLARGDEILQDILTKSPMCALNCFIPELNAHNCSVASVELLQNCVCTNVPLLSKTSTCVQQNCNWEEALVARDLTAFKLCHGFPKESRVADSRNIAIVGFAITIPVVALRIASRIHSSGKLWWDDYTCLIATTFLMTMLSMQLVASTLGFGTHFWDIEEEPGRSLLKFFWVGQMFYIVVRVFAKISILVLYQRLFQSRWCQWAVKGMIAFMALHGAVFLFADIFQCMPVSAVYDRRVQGKCLNFTAIVYAGGALSIVEDFILLAIPIPDLWNIQLNRKKKIGLGLMFGIGTVATVTSIIRMNYIIKFWSTYDHSWDNVDPIAWSIIEEFCAIVCGSLPPCRSLLSAMVPRIFSTIGLGSSFTSGMRSRLSSTRASRNRKQQHSPAPATIGGTGAERNKFSMYRITADADELNIKFGLDQEPPLPILPLQPPHHSSRIATVEEGRCSESIKSTSARLRDPGTIRLPIHTPREVVAKKTHIANLLRRESLAQTNPTSEDDRSTTPDAIDDDFGPCVDGTTRPTTSGGGSVRTNAATYASSSRSRGSRPRRSVTTTALLLPLSGEAFPESEPPTIPQPVTLLLNNNRWSTPLPPSPPDFQRCHHQLGSSTTLVEPSALKPLPPLPPSETSSSNNSTSNLAPRRRPMTELLSVPGGPRAFSLSLATHRQRPRTELFPPSSLAALAAALRGTASTQLDSDDPLPPPPYCELSRRSTTGSRDSLPWG